MWKGIVFMVAAFAAPTMAADQTLPGAGNGAAEVIANRSPLVQSAVFYLIEQAHRISNSGLRSATLDILTNPHTCVEHRANLTVAQKQAIVNQLLAQGLVNAADGNAITGGIYAGIFPAILNDGDGKNACPQLPQPFASAPGSGNNSHHAYPGGLPVHESNNDRSDELLSAQYHASYLTDNFRDLPSVFPLVVNPCEDECFSKQDAIDEDAIIAAPIWHDWAKSMVFQWNADGSEFVELSFGGAGVSDNNGAAGDSRTGGHHILSIAEAMKRGLSPLQVITQASAHSAPTLGNEFKVVNWLRAAAIIAQIDPIATGYLSTDSLGHPRLPPLTRLKTGVDLNANGQTNLRVEYALHNLSDSDFVFSIPAITSAQVLLATLAPQFGYDPNDTATYNTKYRNPALAFLGGERLLILYGSQGLPAVQAQLQKLRALGVI
jgi:hypothetical protein